MTAAIREIFIASNFEEFAPLRAELRERINASTFARAIDLGQNRADPSSVEELSVGRVRSADLVVVLVGERYGRCVDGRKLSYTHLEYRAARAEKVPVLPYFIGPDVSRGGVVKESGKVHDIQLQALKREIMASHIVSFHPPSDPTQIADTIFDRAREFFLEGRADVDADDEESGLGEIGQPPGEDFSSLNGQAKLLEDTLSSSQLEVLQRPARTASFEQLLEARRAYQMGDRHAAILHFRKALELRPLAFEAGYSLARLLATSTRVRHCREASRLALRMARLADAERHSIGKGLALAVAAHAELSQGNEDRAVELVREAIEAVETRASVRIEGAAIYAAVGLLPRALEQARRAFSLRPESFIRLQRNPILRQSSEFRALSLELETTISQLVNGLRQVYRDSLALETSLSPAEQPRQDQAPEDVAPSGPSLLRNVRIGKNLGKSVLNSLQSCASGLLRLRAEIDIQGRRVAALQQDHSNVGSSSPSIMLGLLVSALMLVSVAVAWVAGADARWPMLALPCASFGGTLLVYRRQRASVRRQIDVASVLERQLLTKLESSAESFLRLVDHFERAAVNPLSGMFSPTVGPHRAQLGRDVRLRTAEPRAQSFELDVEVLPPELGVQLVSRPPPADGARVFRVVRREAGKWVASRAACYFDREMLAPIPLGAPGREASRRVGRPPAVRQPPSERRPSEEKVAALARLKLDTSL
jgi:tetratricopeptide (TPR) repeat protein